MLATFLGTLAMWWLHFGTSSEDATETITRSDDPGRIGAYFHYAHAVLVAGIIATAVGNDLVMGHPHDAAKPAYALILAAGPVIYLGGSAIYKRIVFGSVPVSHLTGIAMLALLVPVFLRTDLLSAGWLTTAVMLAVGLWEGRLHRSRHRSDAAPPAVL